jgi:hypothetical protein
MSTNICTVAGKFSIIAVLKKINYGAHKGIRDNETVIPADEKIRGKLCLNVDGTALKWGYCAPS